MLMVKPAHTYLDMIYRIKQRFPPFLWGRTMSVENMR